MTTGPTDVKVTTAAGGPDGMPLALKLNEGLGFTRALQQLFQRFSGATLGFARTLLVGNFRVAEVAVLLFGHAEGIRVIRFAALVGALAIAAPVFAQDDTFACRKERCEVVNSQGKAAVAVSSPRVGDLNACVQVQGVKAGDGFIDGCAELLGSGSAPSGFLSGPIPSMYGVPNKKGARDGDPGSDKWYWYVQFPTGVLLLLWAAGCFRGRGDGHDGGL